MNCKYYRGFFAFVTLLAAVPAAAQTPAPTAAAADVQSGPISAEQFARAPFISQPRISPDGTHIAGLVNI